MSLANIKQAFPGTREVVYKIYSEMADDKEWEYAVRIAGSFLFIWDGEPRNHVLPSGNKVEESLRIGEQLEVEMEKEAKGKKGLVLISYSWGRNHQGQAIAREVESFLTKNDYAVWRDERSIKGDMYTSIAQGIRKADYFLALMSPEYSQSAICRYELNYASEHHKRIIPCVITRGYEPKHDDIGLIIAGKLLSNIADESTREVNLKTMMDKELRRE